MLQKSVSKIKGCRFALQNVPFGLLKRAVSPSETCRFAGRNGTFCNPADYQSVTETARVAARRVKNQSSVMARRVLAAALLCGATLCAAARDVAQGDRGWEQYLSDIAAMEDGTEADWERIYDELCDIEANPIDINAATRDDLGRLPFLTDAQVSDILEYVYRHGPVASLAELQLVESLDYARRHLLQCFVCAGSGRQEGRPAPGQLLKSGRHELTAALRQPLYEREGDRNGYLGYRQKHWLRYTFSAGDLLSAGFAASQDGGEPFFAAKNTLGYDFYSFYIRVGRLGPVRSVIAGRYTASFGMGLVANTGFSPGKLSALSSLGRAPAGLRPTASRSAAGYLQGVAATVSLCRGVGLSLFASYRPHDATLNADDGSVRTIVTSGYHRTPAEMEKKNNTHSATAGMNVSLSRGGFRVGATAVYTHYDRPLRPGTDTPYRRHYPEGSDFANASVDYGYASHAVTLRGETAINRRGSVATVNALSLSPCGGLTIVALHRFYSCRYTALLADAFSEGGHVQNEHGAYIGADWRPTGRLCLSAYFDYARFAWPRYRVSLPSQAFDNALTASYTADRWRIDARYRVRHRQRDNADKTALRGYTERRLRLAFGLGADGGAWNGRTQVDAAQCRQDGNDLGLMVSQSAEYRRRWLRVSAFVAWFATDSYDSRLYAYESGPLYSFSFPAYYGRGLRYSLMVRADIGRRLMLLAKAGVTDYFDRSTIGSGHRRIDGSSMADIDLQLRWRF